jgi:hypothetical protein
LAISASVIVPSLVTGSKSLSASYGTRLRRLWFAPCVVFVVMRIVCPSGSARATFWAATTPLAPPMFSMTIGCPRVFEAWSPMMRATASVALPAANGTTNLIARFG